MSIDVPPLRDRRGDLPVLVEHFLRRFRREDGAPGISARAMAALAAYSYPGNVRELEHAIQHAGVLARGRDIDVEHLPPLPGGLTGFTTVSLNPAKVFDTLTVQEHITLGQRLRRMARREQLSVPPILDLFPALQTRMNVRAGLLSGLTNRALFNFGNS